MIPEAKRYKADRSALLLISSTKMIPLFLIGIVYTVSAASDYNSQIIFYHGSTNDSFPLSEADNILVNTNFIKSRPIALYFHGHNENAMSDTVKAIVSSYIKNDGYNILILDWHELAAEFYPISAARIDSLGFLVAQFIRKLIAQGYPISEIHVVGHSLGAQLGGSVGRYVKSLSNNTQILARISGLDPAGPDFYGLTLGTKAISKNDANFVDVIHTDARIYGAPHNTGTVDFWPNGGFSLQPGCQTDICSHQRSVFLFAESVANKAKVSFTARSKSDNKIQVQMGNNCPVTAQPGVYLLETNSQSPFSLE